MPRLYSSRQITEVLQRKGFVYISQRGSHVKFRKEGKPALIVIVPANKKEIPFGTLRSILRQARLTEDEFQEELK